MIENDRPIRLVFHFYVPENWRNIEIIKVHLNCLEYYSSIFTESIFVLSLDDVNNTNLIKEFETEIINRGFTKVTFKIDKNTLRYEVKTLKEQIIDKLPELDGMTFFAHSKGIGNEIFGSCSMDNLKWWVCACYYYSLNFYREAAANLYGVWGVSFGSFKNLYQDIDNKYHWMYSGTFYWLNCPRLYDKYKREGVEIRSSNDRFFSELFLGDILPTPENPNTPNIASSHNEAYLKGARNFYNDTYNYITLITGGDELIDITNFKNKMCEQ